MYFLDNYSRLQTIAPEIVRGNLNYNFVIKVNVDYSIQTPIMLKLII